MKASDLEPIHPRYLAYSEADGAVSMRADVVARRLNDLLAIVQKFERGAIQCGCANCGVGWPKEDL